MANARAANAHECLNLFMRISPLPAWQQPECLTTNGWMLLMAERSSCPELYYLLSSGNSK